MSDCRNLFPSGTKTAVDEFIQQYPDDYEIIKLHKFAGHFCILREIK